MIAVAPCKIKYNGCILKSGERFVANDSDAELLASWGCEIVDNETQPPKPAQAVHQDAHNQEKKKTARRRNKA